MDEKKQLRRDLLSRRDALSMEELRRAEILITERILGHQWFYRSDTILGFMSFGSEIETRQLLEEALRKNKKVFLPRVEGENMRFYRTGLDETVVLPGLRPLITPNSFTVATAGLEDFHTTPSVRFVVRA